MKLKLKTRKAVRKRFKLTSRGKLLHARASRRHLMTGKRAARRRHLRRWARVDKTDEQRVRHALPYG